MRRSPGDLTNAPSPPSARSLLATIRAGLRARADAAVRVKLETLIPGAKTIGVPVPAMRSFAADLRVSHRTLPLGTLLDVMDELAAGRVREEILIGTFWLARYGRQLETLPWRRLARWLPTLDNWETCDQLAMGVAARVVAVDIKLVGELLTLTESRSEWTRRFALATASALNQKGRSHVPETLSICAPLLADPSPNVRKAVGWALREACKGDAEAVTAFLRARAAGIPRSVMREGTQKLPAARRAELIESAMQGRAGGRPAEGRPR